MCLKIKLRQKEYTFEKTMLVIEVLKALNLSTQSHLVVKDGELLTEYDILHRGDTAEIIAVISGG